MATVTGVLRKRSKIEQDERPSIHAVVRGGGWGSAGPADAANCAGPSGGSRRSAPYGTLSGMLSMLACRAADDGFAQPQPRDIEAIERDEDRRPRRIGRVRAAEGSMPVKSRLGHACCGVGPRRRRQTRRGEGDADTSSTQAEGSASHSGKARPEIETTRTTNPGFITICSRDTRIPSARTVARRG